MFTSDEMAARVRGNVVPATIAAVLMTLYGFFYLAEPAGTDLFSRSAWVFFHTLRIGGVAMAALALWSLSGHRHALLADAIVSWLIGASLILTGVGMLIDGGGALQSILNVVFGSMFVSAGTHNGRAFSASRPIVTQIVAPEPALTKPVDGASWLAGVKASSRRAVQSSPEPELPAVSTARRMIDSGAPEEAPAHSSRGASRSTRSARADSINDTDDGLNIESSRKLNEPDVVPAAIPPGESGAAPGEVPPEGFLASFADKRPPRQS
jgi:hypothetical protein